MTIDDFLQKQSLPYPAKVGHAEAKITQYATEEAMQRLTRMTKKELLGTVGQCVGILLAYWDLRQQYDYLSATLDILRDQDHAILDRIKEIERIYDEDITDPRLTQLFAELPQELWVV